MNPFGQLCELCEWHNCHPLLFVLSVKHDRHIVYAGIHRRLIHRGIQVESFSSLDLKMHTVQISNDVFTFQPRELLPTSSSNPQSVGNCFRGFQFSAFAFVA